MPPAYRELGEGEGACGVVARAQKGVVWEALELKQAPMTFSVTSCPESSSGQGANLGGSSVPADSLG